MKSKRGFQTPHKKPSKNKLIGGNPIQSIQPNLDCNRNTAKGEQNGSI